jgi:hypothetical protein
VQLHGLEVFFSSSCASQVAEPFAGDLTELTQGIFRKTFANGNDVGCKNVSKVLQKENYLAEWILNHADII